MFAAHNRLDNLVAVCDYNKLQIDGFTADVLDLEPLTDKWKAFGWEVFEMDGHDWEDIYTIINKAVEIRDKPVMIIGHTIKSKDNRITENKVESHNIKVPDEQAYQKYMNALVHQDIKLPY